MVGPLEIGPFASYGKLTNGCGQLQAPHVDPVELGKKIYGVGYLGSETVQGYIQPAFPPVDRCVGVVPVEVAEGNVHVLYCLGNP